MRKLSIIILIAIIGTTWSCSSSKKSFESGNYYSSVMQSVDKLRKSPNNKKSREVLSQAYPMAVDFYLNQVTRMKDGQDRFKNGKIVDSYKMLNNMHDAIRRSPAALEVIPNPEDFYNQLKYHTREAASEQYTAGEEALAMGSRSYAIQAYDHFIQADLYQPGYLDVKNKIDEARYFATLKVLVEQVPVPTMQAGLSAQFFQDQLEQFLFNYQENEFIRFYSTRDENLKEPDQILVLQFDDFVVGQVNHQERIIEASKDSVVIGQVTTQEVVASTDSTRGYTRDKNVNVYGTVKATFRENTRQVISRGLLSMRIMDAKANTVVLHDKFPGEFVWMNKWGNFNGDERALTEEQLQVTKQQPMQPPPPQTLFIEFCKPIYGQVTTRVRSYYHNL